MPGVFAAPKRCCREPAYPSGHTQCLASREVERSAEAVQLAIKSEQQSGRWQRLHHFWGDMARIAEARSGHPGFVAIEQKDFASFSRQGEGGGRADRAGADHGDGLLLAHANTVYDLRSSRQPVLGVIHV
jgi:hypothetical protein